MNKEITLKKYINDTLVKERIQEMLQDKAQQFVISLLSTVNNNSALASCDPASVLNAAMTSASLGLPINQNLGFAYIIPYKDKAQFQMGYKGFIQLAQRSGKFKTINVSDVRQGEISFHDRLTGEIIFEWAEENRDKLPIIGYVGFMELINGFKKTMFMTMDELKKHGMKFSQTMKKGYGLWTTDFDAMASKTIIKMLISKWAPLSTEMEQAQLADQAIIKDDGELEYIDNTPETASDVAADKEKNRLIKHIADSKDIAELEVCDEFCVTDDLKKLYDKRLKELSVKK